MGKLAKHNGQFIDIFQVLRGEPPNLCCARSPMSPYKFTFVQLINACDGSGALEDNRLVHEQLIQSGYQFDSFVCNSLVNMYAKCGSMWNVSKGQKARELFQSKCLCGEQFGGHVCKIWEHGRCLESVQQESL